MSHVVTVRMEIRDRAAIEAACRRLGLAAPQEGRHRLYAEQREGLAVRLPEWRYPVVCDLETGELHYDTYRGRWGDEKHLDAFRQAYAVERARAEARKAGAQMAETRLKDGSIRITIEA